MEICEELILLAKEFKKKKASLYLVGGYVRNHLLGLPSTDFDICSSLSEDKVLSICTKLKAKTSRINKSLGTILIQIGNYKFEYTRFRSESYSHNGTHTPVEIKFVEDINIDCLRRDFTINSLYYDILENRLIDLVCGQKDLERKLIKTTQDPSQTFSDDALRILRAIRFSATLDMDIEKSSLKALKTFSPLLKSISKERILKELQAIVVADLKYNYTNKRFLKTINKTRMLKYIFNYTLNNIKAFSKKDIINFYNLSTNSRLIGFYILILCKHFSIPSTESNIAYTINNLLGINGLKETNNSIITTEKLFKILTNLNTNTDTLNASINYLTLSTSEREIIDAFISKKAKQTLSDNIKHIKDSNLPLSIHQLDICAQDLLDNNIERKYISKILSTLYNQVLNMCVANEKDALTKLAIQINETFTEINKQIEEKL